MPKIAFITNLYPSSIEPYTGTFVKNSYEDFKQSQWETTLIPLRKTNHILVSYIKFYVQAFRKLLNFKGLAYIHYVSHSSPPAILAKLFNPRLKIVLHYHGSDAFPESTESTVRQKIKGAICKVANTAADHIIAPSDEFKHRIAKKFNIRTDKISTNPSGGIDDSIFNNHSREPSKEISITYASRMIKGKGAIVAATSISKLNRKDIKVNFIGHGPEREQALKILIDSNTNFNASTLVPQTELANIFRRTEIFIFPSTRQGESLGLTWLEAVFCGAIPLIISNGITEKLIPVEFQELLVAKDADGLTQKLAYICQNRHEIQRINRALIERYRNKYSRKASFISLNKELNSIIHKDKKKKQ